MSHFIEVGKVRTAILEAIGKLIEFEKAATAYAAEPSHENGEALVQGYTKVASSSELLEMHLETMVKQAHAVDGEMVVVAAESENGIRLA